MSGHAYLSGGWQRLVAILFLVLLFQSCRTPEPFITPVDEPEHPREQVLRRSLNQMLQDIHRAGEPVEITTGVRVSRLHIDEQGKIINIYFNDRFSYTPVRPETVDAWHRVVREQLPRRLRNYDIKLFSLGVPIEELIPNYYRASTDDYDRSRMPYADGLRPAPLVQRHDRHVLPKKGLQDRHIALWHSHGWYYEQNKKRWEWQRPRLFTTAEDLLPMAFVIPYIIPMLENAGAYIWVPRERDLQVHEVVVDFDGSTGGSITEAGGWEVGGTGFGLGDPPYGDGVNPFRLGSWKYHESSREPDASVSWIPDIPEKGTYAVYVSYASLENSADDVLYSIYHRGGRTNFTVNQTIGGGTWIYLGHFEFDQGVNPENGRVELNNYSRTESVITADAVRFGGGMGNIVREGQISGRPRYLEAARYYLQYAGMPDSLVYGISRGRSDNIDDFRSRGEWVNYLKGAPFGPSGDPDNPGLGIPVELSVSFHTDAGITRNDTVVGTLMIYSLENEDSLRVFPDKVSRFANRDFADIMQTMIVDDIRQTWDPAWNRRHLFNRMYSEAFRPNVPALLLELLSHQNFLDMQFALDPGFRFDVSRTIYKSILKYLSDSYQYDYVVQPLPVSNLRIIPHTESEVLLRWEPVDDPLEPTAVPEAYIVYKKRGDEPFDNGRLTHQPQYLASDLEPGELYQFKVVAVNDGGKSFPSETLAVSLNGKPQRPLLIVNGFERVAGPDIVDEPEFKGFARFKDSGVPDRYDILFTGDQFNYDPDSEWRTNDAPGHGASYADYETRIIPGNTFNFPGLYGSILRDLGLPFTSASAASIRDRQIDLNNYDAVILILGNQRTTNWPKQEWLNREPEFQVFPERMREELVRYIELGGRLFISGSHVGTDAELRMTDDPGALAFLREKLHVKIETNHAARTGVVRSVSDELLPAFSTFTFNTGYHPDIYTVDAPDAIEPYGKPIPSGTSSIDDGQSGASCETMEYGQTAELPTATVAGLTSRSSEAFDIGEYEDNRGFDTPAKSAENPAGPDYGTAIRWSSARLNLVPADPQTLMRYEENQFGAAVGYRTEKSAVVTFGFPFETIIDPAEREKVLRGVLLYLGLDLNGN